MAKNNEIKRSTEDLKNELREQIVLLMHACESFDRGLEPIGKHISLILRVLLHHRGNSKALLEQLGIREKRFFDSAGELNSKNLLTECNLVGGRISASSGKYTPLVQMGEPPIPPKKIPFAEWWNNPVLKDNKGRFFCRRELVLNVADTDGGAHVDPTLEEAYMDLSRRNSLGWMFGNNDLVKALDGRPELACMRQIAHEVLLTLKANASEYFNA